MQRALRHPPPPPPLLHPTTSPPAPLPAGTYRNITLRNVTVNNSPARRPANVLVNASNPATGIVFDSVRR